VWSGYRNTSMNKNFLSAFSPKEVGIDLGTTNSLVFVQGRGIVFNEPSIVAVSSKDEAIVAIGSDAREMIGRTPDSILARRPLQDGVVADYRATEAMIRHFIEQVSGTVRFKKPVVMISVPFGVTSTEQRAVIQATMKAGARNAIIANEPLLAALGAGVSVHSSSGSMIVDIGGGTTDIAVIALGAIVASDSLRVGGEKLDLAIADFLRKSYNIAIGEHTSETIKMRIASALPEYHPLVMNVIGSALKTGLPQSITIDSNEIYEAIQGYLKDIVQAVKGVLRETPPELVADIMEKGILLSGGCAHLKSLDLLLREETGVPVYVVEDPALCVTKGMGVAFKNLNNVSKVV